MLKAQGAPPSVLKHFGEVYSANASRHAGVLAKAWDTAPGR